MRTLSILVVALTALSAAVHGSPPAQSANRVIVRSTDLAPVDGPPMLYGGLSFSLGGPTITERGDVWFTAAFQHLDGTWAIPDNGIFVHRDGQSRLVLRQDMPLLAPREGDPLWLMDPTDWGEQLANWNPTGTSVYFTAPETWPPSQPFGIWSVAPNGSLSFQSLDDLLPIANDNVIGVAATRFTEAGPAAIEVLFDDGLPHTATGVFTRDSSGVFSLAARELGPAPGTPDGWMFDVVRLGTQDVAQNGTVLLHGGVIENLDVAFRNPNEPGYTDGVWKRLPGGELELVALSGTIAPGTDRLFRSVAGGQINSRGEAAVVGYLEGGIEPGAGEGGVWTDKGGDGLRKVLAVGDRAPGLPAGFVMTGQGNPRALISESGKIAVKMHAASETRGLGGVWEEDIDGLQPVALEGDQAPGVAAGRLFRSINPHYMNDAGQIVFSARLTGGNPAYRFSEGIWAQDRQGELHLVVKIGDYLEVAPGVFSEVDYLNFSTSSSEYPVINNRGQIVFHATFTDGTQAIVVSDVVAIPEPSGWILAVGFAVLSVGTVWLRKHRWDSTIAS